MGIGIWQLVIILAILVLLFGAKRLKTAGGDLGSAIRGFRSAMNEKPTDDEGNQGSR
jgi:sec-independent protein translocase protein TatA